MDRMLSIYREYTHLDMSSDYSCSAWLLCCSQWSRVQTNGSFICTGFSRAVSGLFLIRAPYRTVLRGCLGFRQGLGYPPLRVHVRYGTGRKKNWRKPPYARQQNKTESRGATIEAMPHSLRSSENCFLLHPVNSRLVGRHHGKWQQQAQMFSPRTLATIRRA